MILGRDVLLSKRSQELIVKYLNLYWSGEKSLTSFSSSMDYLQLISWLNDEIKIPAISSDDPQQEPEFLLASLRAELLRDLSNSMGDDNLLNIPVRETDPSPIKFWLLALAGTLLAGCEGFDSITTMLSVLSLPSLVILIAGVSFSVLSIAVFYGYDLMQVSKNLGVTLREAPKLLDVFLLQMNQIKIIRKKINSYKIAELLALSGDELVQLENTITMLHKRFQALVQASTQFENALYGTEMQVAKIIVSSLAGLLFFGSGFFAGQSVALFVASLFIPVVLPTFWPVIAFSFLVGVAAFSLYWYVEQEGLKRLVSGWFGLDEDKIEELCDKNSLDKEERKLEHLKEKVKTSAKLANLLNKPQNQIADSNESEKKAIEDPAAGSDTKNLKSSTNIYSFLRHPKSIVEPAEIDGLLSCQYS